MRWFLLLLLCILFVGCSASVPADTPAPTVDVAATVESAVGATRSVEREVRATVDAHVEAAPTVTPVVITVFAPGQVEESISRFYDCLQEDVILREIVLDSLGADLAEYVLNEDKTFGNREVFFELFLPIMESYPDYVALGGLIDDLCTDSSSVLVSVEDALKYWMIDYHTVRSALDSEITYLGELSELREEPEDVEGSESSFSSLGAYMSYFFYDAVYAGPLGELYDCYHSNLDVRDVKGAEIMGHWGGVIVYHCRDD